MVSIKSVSYTHLDVYKRQLYTLSDILIILMTDIFSGMGKPVYNYEQRLFYSEAVEIHNHTEATAA